MHLGPQRRIDVKPETTDDIQPPARVVLGLDPRDPYQRAMVEGIIEHTYDRGLWEILLAPEREMLQAHLAADEAPDGCIAVYGKADRDLLISLDVPTVLLLHHTPLADFSLVTDDESAVAALAIDYYRQRGLERLAFFDSLAPPTLRRTSFEQHAAKVNLPCHAYPPIGYCVTEDWNGRTEAVGDWILSIPKPVGVLCFHISEAQQLSMACRRRGIRVPEEVAILSTNGDDIECHLAHPPLSAIDLGGERLGRAAAERLSQMMAGGSREPTMLRLPPTGITRRQSTDLQAASDPHVAEAIELIRRNASEGLSVREIVRESGLSRRRLEYAFKRTVGRTLHQQIRYERIEQAKRLLIRTDLSLTDIALRCGFSYPARLSEAFRRELGTTPSQFRAEN